MNEKKKISYQTTNIVHYKNYKFNQLEYTIQIPLNPTKWGTRAEFEF